MLSSGPLRPFDDPCRPVLVLATFSAALGVALLESRRTLATAIDGDRRLPSLRSAASTGVAVLPFVLGAAALLAPPDPHVQLASFAGLSAATVPPFLYLVLPRYGVEAGPWTLGYGVALHFVLVLVALPLRIASPQFRHLAVTAVLVLVAGAFFANRVALGAASRERSPPGRG